MTRDEYIEANWQRFVDPADALPEPQRFAEARRNRARIKAGQRWDVRLTLQIEKPHLRKLWGSDREVHPKLVTEVFGDGKLLVGITPTNTRPEYYVVRVDSKFAGRLDDTDFRDLLDEVYDSIFDQFGNADEDGDGDGDEGGWPELDLSVGSSWFEYRLDNPPPAIAEPEQPPGPTAQDLAWAQASERELELRRRVHGQGADAMSTVDVLRKADTTIAELTTSGGYLNERQAQRFYDLVVGPQAKADGRKRPRRIVKRIEQRKGRVHWRIILNPHPLRKVFVTKPMRPVSGRFGTLLGTSSTQATS